MTIDEAIAHAKEVANSWKLNQEDCDFNTDCNNCAESCEECAKEHEQLAEWLEELKTYKEKEFDVLRQDGQLLYKQGIIDGYNKAIDEFAETLTERLRGMQMVELQGEDVCPCNDTGEDCPYINQDIGCQYCAREQTIKDINEIAEQLKVGGAK